MFIYLVWHGDYEDREVMGAYSTHELAVAASYRIHGKLSAYSIERVTLDEDNDFEVWWSNETQRYESYLK